ncbi:MAG: radical SAM family heme chaperone HemW, partial [Chlamydiae bacterium]|nr:radical SAM family heme chaperone HemW [Chlamydiota bacterium]
CSKKCPYCHFYVLTSKETAHGDYIEVLLQEWRQKLPLLQGKVVYSIYFGGGTPSQVSPWVLEKLFKEIFASSLTFHPSLEVTFEANPEDLTASYLQHLKSLPINRLSIGVQSLHDETLKILERQHDAARATQSLEMAFHLGFSNISIDLMYDLPHQTPSSWEYTLNALEGLPITHLSLYNLTIEPHTSFYKRKKKLEPFLPDEDKSLYLLQQALEAFASLGLERYEVSAFAKEGFYSRHNVGYWLGREFHGYGPSAFSYYQGRRFRSVEHLHKYSQAIRLGLSAKDFEEKLEEEASLRELLAIRLRLLEGVNLKAFPLFSQDLSQTLINLKKDKFLKEEDGKLFLSSKGLLFYDSVATEII